MERRISPNPRDSDFSYILKNRLRIKNTDFVGFDIEGTLVPSGNKIDVPIVFTFSSIDPYMKDLFKLIEKREPLFTKYLTKSVEIEDVSVVYSIIGIQNTPSNLQYLYAIMKAVQMKDLVLTAHWAAFDFLATFNFFPELQEIIVALFKTNNITCTLIRESLLSLALNRFDFDRRFNRKVKRYSLGMLMEVYLDLKVDKEINKTITDLVEVDSWRLSYTYLANVPIVYWPKPALDYSLEDTVFTALIAILQTGNGNSCKTIDGDTVYAENTIADEFRQVRASFALVGIGGHGLYKHRANVIKFIEHTVKAVKLLLPFERLLGIIRGNPANINYDTLEKFIKDNDLDIQLTDAQKVFYKTKLFPLLQQTAMSKRKSKGKEGTGDKLVLCTMIKALSDFYGVNPRITKTGLKKLASGEIKPGNVPLTYISAEEDALNFIPDPLIDYFVDNRGFSKLLNTYIPMLLSKSQLIVCNVNPLLATGRGAMIEPAMQTAPRKGGFRECFCGADGEVINSTDFHVAELVSLAECCFASFGASELRTILNKGIDPHCVMGAEIISMPLDEFVKIYKTGGSHPLYEKIDKARQAGKIGDFGVPGALGAEAFVIMARKQYGVVMSEIEAKYIINTFKGRIPEINHLFKSARRATSAGTGTAVQLYSGRVRGGCDYKQYCNTQFQGLTSDGAKAGCFELFVRGFVEHASSPHLRKAKVIGFVHDETISRGPENDLRWAMELSDIQAKVMNVFTPNVTSKCEPCISRIYTKAAKTLYDENGIVRVWSPGE